MSDIPFVKMHGLGNDFAVFDARIRPLVLDEAGVRAVADRRRGVGCDQVVVVEPAENASADASLRIFNADGSEAEACGNATRCVAHLLMREKGTERVHIETLAGLLEARRNGGSGVSVDMGRVRLDWRDIPLSRAADTLCLDFKVGPLSHPVAVNLGNPHVVFFVDDPEAVDLERYGPRIENHPLFPRRVNVGVARVETESRIRLRVWERGVGITPACGSAACAAAVAAHRRGLAARAVEVALAGGTLGIDWRDDGHVWLTGPVALSFTGELDSSVLGRRDG